MQVENSEVTEPEQTPTPVCCLRGLSGVTTGKNFALTGDTFIGRHHDCHIVIKVPGISRHHAKIGISNGRYYLQDLNSVNGTTVNGISIETILLSPGDEIAFDNTRFVFKEIAGDIPDDDSYGQHATLRSDLRSKSKRGRKSPPLEPDTEPPATKIITHAEHERSRKGRIFGITALVVTLLFLLLGIVSWLILPI